MNEAQGIDPKPLNTPPGDPQPPSQFSAALKQLCEAMGMRLHKLGGDKHEWRVTVRTIPHFAEVTFDVELARPAFEGGEVLLSELDAARQLLFNAVAKHMAEHDRSPRDRLEQVEAAARALVEHLKQQGIAGHTTMLVFRLMALLDAKPGGVAWRDPR